MSDAILKLKNLSCGYAKGFSLEGVSLEISSGKVCGIIGPNGSGKTTILRAATGVLPMKSGSVEFDGRDIGTMSLMERAKSIAVVMQESSSPFEMNVLEYVMLGRIPHNKGAWFADSSGDAAMARKMLDTCGAANFASRNLDELSGGERQLVHISRALAQEPRMLLLDEPTNHLDLSHQHQIMSLAKSLSEDKDIAVGVVLHDLNLAARFCDIIHLVHKGRIHSSGPPEDILRPEILGDVYSAKIASCPDPVNGKPLIFMPL